MLVKSSPSQQDAMAEAWTADFLVLGQALYHQASLYQWLPSATLTPFLLIYSDPGGDATARAVNLNIKHGAEMKDYDAIAKAEKLKPLEKELRKLEDLSESIVNDFAYMRSREEEMRDTNGRSCLLKSYFGDVSLLLVLSM